MDRLTTDNPQNNTEVALNLVYVKDGQAWVRNGGPDPGYPDVTLYDYMRLIIADHGPMSVKADITDDEIGDALDDALFDGIETKEGLCAMLYTLAWASAELRQRLAAYEDTGLEPEEVKSLSMEVIRLDWERRKEEERTLAAMWGYGIDPDRLTDIMDAEAEGRLLVLPCKVGDTVYTIIDGKIYEGEVYHISYSDYYGKVTSAVRTKIDFLTASIGAAFEDFGKTAFFTRAAAEAALGKERDV